MRIALAYSGSLDGSAAIAWLRDRHHAEVVTVTLDLGQGRELEAIRDRALSLGAQRAHVLDAREAFAHEFVVPALRADAMTGGLVPMAMTLSRPLIAQRLAEIARIERADAVAHTGRGIDGSSRLDQLLAAIAPGLRIVTPAAEWALAGADLEAFASRHGLASDDATRVDANLWGRSLPYQGGAAPTSLVAKATDACPAEPAFVDITFTKGVPTALNGVALPLIELVSSLGTLASTHGVGHVSAAGLLCDAPAAVLLHAAHRDLTDAASTADLQRFLALATEAYVGVIEGGRWFSPLREALDACFAAAQSRVNGHVRLRLLKGDYSTIATELSRPDVLSRLPLVPSYAQH